MKRGYIKTDSIVLSAFDYGESDKIITFYTGCFGKLKGIAKGAKRSKKRFVGNLEPLKHTALLFFQTEKSELVRIEDSFLIDGFCELKHDVMRFASACYMLELVDRITPIAAPNSDLFKMTVDFLRLMNGGEDKELFLRFFEIKLLTNVGYMPHLTGCVACKKDLIEVDVFFSSEKGGVLCSRCSSWVKDIVTVSAGTVEFLKTALKLDVEKLKRLVPSRAFREESGMLLDNFIKYQIGYELKSKKFIEKMLVPAKAWNERHILLKG